MLRGPLVNAMRNGTLRPSVLVMPTVGSNSWWIDGAVDAAASAFLEDLMPAVEARLSFPVHRQRRALVGVSMGGFGALQFALSQPQRFCAAALISPTVYDPLPPPESAARRTPQFVRDGAVRRATLAGRQLPRPAGGLRARAAEGGVSGSRAATATSPASFAARCNCSTACRRCSPTARSCA